MLVNFSNHSLLKWSDRQTIVAKDLYGNIVDLPFPMVNPDGDSNYILELAKKCVSDIVKFGTQDEVVVHVMGELSLSFCVVCMLNKIGYKCVVSTTERNVVEISPEKKETIFKFVMFREYCI